MNSVGHGRVRGDPYRRDEWGSSVASMVAVGARAAQRALVLARHGNGYTVIAPYGMGSITVSDIGDNSARPFDLYLLD